MKAGITEEDVMAAKRRASAQEHAWTRARPSAGTRSAGMLGLLVPTAHGPIATLRTTRELQQVHLRQGDMDGACGPYAVIMGLLALGLVDRDEVTGLHRLDGRRKFAKLWRCFNDAEDPMLRQGTDLADLCRALDTSFPRDLHVDLPEVRGAKLFDWARSAIEDNAPVIVGFDWPDGAHWALVVGYECDTDGKTDSLLLLDSSAERPCRAVFNAFIRNVGRRGTWPYEYFGDDADPHSVSLDAAIALRGRKTPPA